MGVPLGQPSPEAINRALDAFLLPEESDEDGSPGNVEDSFTHLVMWRYQQVIFVFLILIVFVQDLIPP